MADKTVAYDGYIDSDLDDFIDKPEKPKKVHCPNRPLLTIVQMAVCMIALLAAVVLKSLGGDIYTTVHDWYFSLYDDSVFTDGQINLDFLLRGEDLSGAEESTEESTDEEEEVQAAYSLPLASCTVTSSYGERTADDGTVSFHKGLDLDAETGENIYSMTSGTVITAEESSSYGIYLVVDSGSMTFLYAHCSELCVSLGDSVEAGGIIAKAGDTGNARGVHLHLEIAVNGENINPAEVLETISV